MRPQSVRVSEDNERSAVKSLRKAVAVLDAVARAERPLTMAELAVRAGIAGLAATIARWILRLRGGPAAASVPAGTR